MKTVDSTIPDAVDQQDPDGMVAAFLASAVAMLGLMPVAILPLFLGALVDDLGISPEFAGGVVSAHLLGNALGALAVSTMLRLYKLTKFVYIGVLVEVAAELFSLYSEPSTSTLLFSRLMAGFGGGLATGAAFSWLATRADPDRGFGLLFAFQFFMSALLLYVLPGIIPSNGVSVFYVLYIATALVSVLCSFAINLNQESTAPSEDGAELKRPVINTAAIVRALAAVALFEIAVSGIWAYIERLGLDWGLTPNQIGIALSVGTLVGIPGALIVVVLGTRWGRSKAIACGVLFCIFSLIALLADFHAFWVYVFALLLFSGAWSFTVPYIQGVQAELDPTGRVAVLGMFVTFLAIAVGPIFFGLLIGDRGYVVALLLACVLFCACLLSVFSIARRQDFSFCK